MTARLDPFAAAPVQMKTWMGTSLAVSGSVDPVLMSLIEVLASQINGCANCLNMHTVAARERGETEQRLYLLPAWREAPCYTDRERAALGWTEALTRLSERPALDAARQMLETHFSKEEQVQLTLMINIINGWNRLAVGFELWAEPAAAKAMAVPTA